jgi:hypothetical protein
MRRLSQIGVSSLLMLDLMRIDGSLSSMPAEFAASEYIILAD